MVGAEHPDPVGEQPLELGDRARDVPALPAAGGEVVAPVTAQPLDNGSKPHDAVHYLTKKTTGRIIRETVST